MAKINAMPFASMFTRGTSDTHQRTSAPALQRWIVEACLKRIALYRSRPSGVQLHSNIFAIDLDTTLHARIQNMPIDADWTKTAALVLGGVGTALGIYNWVVARAERLLKTQQAFAVTLLALDPILDKMLAVPLSSPDDLRGNTPELVASLRELELAIESDKKDLATLLPRLSGRLLDVRRTSRTLRERLTDRKSPHESVLPEATAYLHAARAASHFRSLAGDHDILLDDQVEPTPENWTGDPKVYALQKRWEAFFRASATEKHT
jgi:hypothetical protein